MDDEPDRPDRGQPVLHPADGADPVVDHRRVHPQQGTADLTRRSAWSRAVEIAGRTPEARNRYVDLLRAVSILAVVSGHWLIAAPWLGERLRLDHLLAVQPWTQWLTLLFQVMPVFFVVGGYSNAASWDAAERDGARYGAWLAGRMRRLIGPVMPLLLVWAALSFVFGVAGVSEATIAAGSKMALVPLWFLAVYGGVCAFVPLTRRAWRRFGWLSLLVPLAAAAAVDALRFSLGWVGFAWINYLLVWIAVHQLGYAWRDGRLANVWRCLSLALAGAAAWYLLERFGPYPRSMVGVPGDPVSNSLPPTIMLPALGIAQTGLLLALERPARRWLARTRPWAATVLVNGMIMSVYLWHLTALTLLIGAAALAGGIGLRWTPGSTEWWLGRIPWFAASSVALLGLLGLVARFERLPPLAGSAPSGLRVVAGVALVGAGIGTLVTVGLAGAPNAALILPVLAGAWLAGAVALPR